MRMNTNTAKIEPFDTMTYPRNESVVSRDGIFDDLDKLLPRDKKPHRAALYGYGGCG